MNRYIFCAALIAAGNLVSPHQGEIIIDDLNKIENRDILSSLYVQAAMITMYAKCSKYNQAINIFTDNINGKYDGNKNGLLYLYPLSWIVMLKWVILINYYHFLIT